MNTKFNPANHIILSLFSGIGLLDAPFENAGFSLLRGPEKILGGDIRRFTPPPPGIVWGVLGGPPCQDFSKARRSAPTGYGQAMLNQFKRVVLAAQPEWFLMENVPGVPDLKIKGYNWQRFDIDLAWYCDVSRPRVIQFGSLSGRLLNVTRQAKKPTKHGAALANDDRSFKQLCKLQGLPPTFNLPDFTMKGKKRAVGNGVPLQIGQVLAKAVKRSYSHTAPVQLAFIEGLVAPTTCICNCGRPAAPGSKFAIDENGSSQTHRKTYERNKKKCDQAQAKIKCDMAASQNGVSVTVPGNVTR